MAFPTATANKILDKILRNVDFTPSATLYLSLHTADPGDSGASEVTGGSYVRQAISFAAAAAKATSNTAVLNFAGMPAATITHVGIWSASTAGTYWWGGAMGASKAVLAGDTFQMPASDVDVVLT